MCQIPRNSGLYKHKESCVHIHQFLKQIWGFNNNWSQGLLCKEIIAPFSGAPVRSLLMVLITLNKADAALQSLSPAMATPVQPCKNHRPWGQQQGLKRHSHASCCNWVLLFSGSTSCPSKRATLQRPPWPFSRLQVAPSFCITQSKFTASFQTCRIPSKIDNCNRSAARRKNGKTWLNDWLIRSSRIITPCQMINHRVVPVPNQFCTTRRVKSSKEMQPGKKISLHQTPSFLVRWIFHPALLH
jgi:hypothetical protein